MMKSDIVFPIGKKDIYDYHDRKDIETIILPDGIRNVGSGCFACCPNLRYVYIPDSVTEIGLAAFEDCKNLEVIEGCRGVKKILTRAFNGTKIKSITLPKNVEMIEGNAFYGFCFASDALERIDFYPSKSKSGWTSIDGILYKGPQIIVFPAAKKGSFVIPGNNKKVRSYAFYHSQLEEITIEEGVEKIGYHSFDGCRNLVKIILPKSVVYVADYAFANCSKLEEVIFQSESVEFQSKVFEGCKKLKKLVVPTAIRGKKDWDEGIPYSLEISHVQANGVSKEEFLIALSDKHPDHANTVIAGLEGGYANSVTPDAIRRSLKAKDNTPYFFLCGDILRELGEYDAALDHYFYFHEDFDLILDCLERAKNPTMFQLNTISMRLARKTDLAKENELVYSYWDSDSDENPWDPTHWTVVVTNYKRAFELVKEAATNGDKLCQRFLALVPKDYEGKIENSESYCF